MHDYMAAMIIMLVHSVIVGLHSVSQLQLQYTTTLVESQSLQTDVHVFINFTCTQSSISWNLCLLNLSFKLR